MERIYRTYHDEGLQAVAINIHPDKDDQVIPWLRQEGISIPGLVGADPERLKREYGVTGAPETFILDAENRALIKHVGFVPGEEQELEAQVRITLGLLPFRE